MKKILLLCLILPFLSCQVIANELTEDYLDIAANYCIEGNYNEALVYLNKILSIEPNNNTAKELKSAALRVMSPTSVSYLSSRNTQVKQALAFKKQGNKSKELSTLVNAVNTNPQNYWVSCYLAEYYRKNNNYNNAVIYYQKALSAKPNFSQCYLNMAVIQYENKNYNSALTSVNKFIQSNPNSDTAYALRAKINLEINNTNNAQNDIKTALSINDDINYRFIEAKILFKTKNYTKAKEKFEILSKDIKTSEIYKYMGLCDYELGSYTNALLNLDKAIILSDDDKTLNSKYNEIKDKLEKR